GITGDAIPTLQIRGANQTAPVVNVDSTSFPQDATVFFQVRVNGARLIECRGNQTIFLGSISVNGNSEWQQSFGRFIATNSALGQGPTIPQISVYATGSHTALAYRLHHGVTGDFTAQNPTGTFQWGINSANGGKHARFTTGIGSSNAAHGTVQITTGGTVTVTNTYCQAGDVIYHSRIAAGGTLGHTTAVAANGSFTITSNNTSDTSTFAWMIVRPA
ncbi:MAG: hypothetical protein ACK5R5_06090, partial [Alphaproteobacteria bacterium]